MLHLPNEDLAVVVEEVLVGNHFVHLEEVGKAVVLERLLNLPESELLPLLILMGEVPQNGQAIFLQILQRVLLLDFLHLFEGLKHLAFFLFIQFHHEFLLPAPFLNSPELLSSEVELGEMVLGLRHFLNPVESHVIDHEIGSQQNICFPVEDQYLLYDMVNLEADF